MTATALDRALQVTVRADAGPKIGYGHLRRTLSLIRGLERFTNIRARYLMLPESDGRLAVAAGCELVHLHRSSGDGVLAGEDMTVSDVLIIDTPNLTTADLEHLRQLGIFTVIFDDGRWLENCPVDIVINAAPGAERLTYQGLATTQLCLGIDYFSLREEFLTEKRPVYRNSVRQVVITLGGSDPDDQTARLVRLFAVRSHSWQVIAILGPGYQGAAETLCAGCESIVLLRNPTNMARVLSKAHLAISGAGGTAMELAYLGVPSLLLVLAPDQLAIATALQDVGSAMNLGWFNRVTDDEIWLMIQELSSDVARLRAMSMTGQRLVDGQGAIRTARCVLHAWQARHPSNVWSTV